MTDQQQTTIPPELLAYVTGFHREHVDPTPREDLRASPTAWDRFNGSATNDYTAGLMEALGWRVTGHTRTGIVNLERPGKDEGSTSATVGAVAPGVLYVHTSSDPVFSEGTPYDAADIYALLHHDGDKAAADKALTATYGGSRRFLSDPEIAEGLESYRRQGEEAAAREAEAKKAVALSGWDSMALDEHSLGNLPDLEWCVKGWIPEGSLVAVYGKPKAGKSFVCVDLAMRMATGATRWLNDAEIRPVTTEGQPHNVAYLVGEGIRGYKGRVQSWRAAYSFNAQSSSITFLNASGHNLIEEVGSLADWLITNNKTVLFIDTLNRFAGGIDENDSKEMTRFVLACDFLRTVANVTVIVVHHEGKDPKAGMRGSTALLGAVDATIRVASAKDGYVTVSLEDAREAESGKMIRLEYTVPHGCTAPALRISRGPASDDREGIDWQIRTVLQTPHTMAELMVAVKRPRREIDEHLEMLGKMGAVTYDDGKWCFDNDALGT